MPGTAIMIHLASATIALGLTTATLSLRKGDTRHRWLGRAAATALIATAITSFWITSRGHFSPIHILSVAILVGVPRAVWNIRHGRVRAHKIAMISMALGLFGAGLGAALAPGRFLHSVLFG